MECTGWQRRRLQGSCFGREGGPPVPADVACPLWVQWQPSSAFPTFLRQYPAAKLGVKSLFEGQQRKAELTFRMWTADHRILEMTCTAWRTDLGEQTEHSSGERHSHVTLTWEMDDCLEIATFPTAPLALPLSPLFLPPTSPSPPQPSAPLTAHHRVGEFRSSWDPHSA